jgi:hypothetical protein
VRNVDAILPTRKSERVGIARDRSEGHQEQVGAMPTLRSPFERDAL